MNYGFDFLDALVADMVQDDPAKRPTMDEVARRFDDIYNALTTNTLRARLVNREEQSEDILVNVVSHWYRRLKYAIQGHPAVPSR